MKKTKLSKAELERYKTMLLDAQKSLRHRIQSMEKTVIENSLKDASGDLTNLPTHIADLSADTFSQNLAIELLENGEEVMKEISEALERIENGSYGICMECEKPIPAKRLGYIPYAKLCVSCKSKEEKSKNRLR